MAAPVSTEVDVMAVPGFTNVTAVKVSVEPVVFWINPSCTIVVTCR